MITWTDFTGLLYLVAVPTVIIILKIVIMWEAYRLLTHINQWFRGKL